MDGTGGPLTRVTMSLIVPTRRRDWVSSSTALSAPFDSAASMQASMLGAFGRSCGFGKVAPPAIKTKFVIERLLQMATLF